MAADLKNQALRKYFYLASVIYCLNQNREVLNMDTSLVESASQKIDLAFISIMTDYVDVVIWINEIIRGK